MKLLLFSTFCVFSFCAVAQNLGNTNTETQKQSEGLRKFKGTNNDELRKHFEKYFKEKNFQNIFLENKKDNIVFLPQDRMPCVVPDTSAIAPMPNAWNDVAVPYKSELHPIPNPALPPQSFKYNLSNKWKDDVK